MKYLLFIIAACSLLACSQEKDRDERIKDILYANVTQGLSADKMQKVDSVRLVSVDSFTDRGRLYKQLARAKQAEELFEEIYKSSVNNIYLYKESITIDKSLGLDHSESETSFKKAVEDTAMKAKQWAHWRAMADSMEQLYNNTPPGTHAGFYVEADVFYTFFHKNDSTRISTYLFNTGALDTNGNLLLIQIDIEKRMKEYDSILHR